MLSHDEGIRVVTRGLILLGIITLIEVAIALVGNGHIIKGLHITKIIMYPAMIGFSLYKAYFIVYEFMHMKYEASGLAKSVLLPTLLLVWGIIAFFQEGGSWRQRREQIIEKNRDNVAPKPTSWNNIPVGTKSLL
ncbi:MAG: cytochrome C oxidase subunit IV family protein [Saprospiraceae bacterium]|jgi:cytochrome c oxidase subunit IV